MSDKTQDHEQDETTAPDSPDFTSASEVAAWFGSEILRLVHAARREKALSRLRALSSAVDSWSKLHRLASESEELETLRAELAELRSMIETERRDGPQEIVKG